MLAQIQKAFELDPVIHGRIVTIEEKKLQSDDKVSFLI